MDRSERRKAEDLAAQAKGGKTNYFQRQAEVLGPPRQVAASQNMQGDQRVVSLTWQTAYASDQPLSHYEIQRDHKDIGRVEHHPQITEAPFAFQDQPKDHLAHRYRVITVDAAGRMAGSEELLLPATG